MNYTSILKTYKKNVMRITFYIFFIYTVSVYIQIYIYIQYIYSIYTDHIYTVYIYSIYTDHILYTFYIYS